MFQGPTAISFDRKGVFGGKWEKPKKKPTVLSADCSGTVGQEPRGDQGAFLLAFALQQTLIVEQANSRHKAKDYAYHMKEHLYCYTTKKDGNQLKEASVCWVL